MANIRWSYLQNPFDNVTKSSFTKMYEMATDHFDKLQAKAGSDPKIAELLATGQSTYDAFTQEFNNGTVSSADYRMATVQMQELLLQLSSKLIRRWDVLIQVEYDISDSRYQSLLPKGRKPFQSGSYDLRINEVEALHKKLEKHTIFETLAAEVEDFAG